MASQRPLDGSYPSIRLPHPYLTRFKVKIQSGQNRQSTYSLALESQPATGQEPDFSLVNDSLSWLDLETPPAGQAPPTSDNSAWARAVRSPGTTFEWSAGAPSLAEIWNSIHAIHVGKPTIEQFRLLLKGSGSDLIRHELLVTGLANEHPTRRNPDGTLHEQQGGVELLILRAAFWQGAASPFGPRPVWAVGSGSSGPVRRPRAQYPPTPEIYHFTNKFPHEPVYTLHPRREPKPHPGSIVYSRYVPEITKHFSLEVVDWQDPTHLSLFNAWQNDPRVAAGWNETGTLDQHREYLRKLHLDPHVLCLFGRFDDARFAYFELYWAREDHYGAHYAAGDYDRGRHSLVGDASFRGSHHVNAWYSSCIHYCFLDDPRTVAVVGEPKAAGAIILSYENAQGLTIGKYVDLGHKRSVHSIASREKWFQLCPLFWDGRERPLESADRAAWNAKL